MPAVRVAVQMLPGWPTHKSCKLLQPVLCCSLQFTPVRLSTACLALLTCPAGLHVLLSSELAEAVLCLQTALRQHACKSGQQAAAAAFSAGPRIILEA